MSVSCLRNEAGWEGSTSSCTDVKTVCSFSTERIHIPTFSAHVGEQGSTDVDSVA